MSYNISFKVKVQDIDKHIDTGYCTANITWNVSDIIRKSTGLEWKNEQNNGLVKDIMPKIYDGIKELVINKDKYTEYEPSNGWGSVETTIGFFNYITIAWECFKKFEPELASCATFWIT